MDYYKRIQQAIDFIEARLQEELKITDIAAKAYFSAFHFQRIFQAISGFTVQEYIRKRRLSEAALWLKETKMNVLEIAVAFQYHSQEAFTRAFASCFGVNPSKYRKANISIARQPKVNFLDYQKNRGMDMNKPNILTLNPIKIVGYEYKTNLSQDIHYNEIPSFYEDFGRSERYLNIPNQAAPNISYGIACNFQDNGEFSFIIGEEVNKFAEAKQLQNGFVNFQIPGGAYAEFKAFGSAHLVQDTRSYIYGTWLPNSNYERTEGPDFEITDVMNSTFPDNLKIKIYIPLKTL